MSNCKYRKTQNPQQVFEIPAANLLPLLQQGILGTEYQFLMPGESVWLAAPETLYRLLVPGPPATSAKPASAKGPVKSQPARPTEPEPDEVIPVGRILSGPRSAVPPQPPGVPSAPQAPVNAPSFPNKEFPRPERWANPPPAPPPPPPPKRTSVSIAPPPVVQSAPKVQPPASRSMPPRPATPAQNAIPELSRNSSLAASILDETERPRLAPGLSNEEDELDMTAMIDVTFLLLIFFMVTSTVSQFANLELPQSVSGDAESPKTSVVLVLDFPESPVTRSDSQFSGGKPIMLSDVRLRLEGSNELLNPANLEQQLQAAFLAGGKSDLVLQAHRKMPASVVREVLNVGRRAGAKKTLVGTSVLK